MMSVMVTSQCDAMKNDSVHARGVVQGSSEREGMAGEFGEGVKELLSKRKLCSDLLPEDSSSEAKMKEESRSRECQDVQESIEATSNLIRSANLTTYDQGGGGGVTRTDEEPPPPPSVATGQQDLQAMSVGGNGEPGIAKTVQYLSDSYRQYVIPGNQNRFLSMDPGCIYSTQGVPQNHLKVMGGGLGGMQGYHPKGGDPTGQESIMSARETAKASSQDDAGRKRELRLLKNRQAAAECRRKKKEYDRYLTNRVAILENQNKILTEELKSLKELLKSKHK